MSSGADFFLKKTLGKDFLESLTKTELWKPGTRSVTDLQDIHLGLKLVPRTMMSFLIKELGPMKDGEHKDIDLPLEGNCRLRVDKHGPDVFSGDLECENKKITEFKFRSIPGVGLVIMSNFQLYDLSELDKESPKHVDHSMEEKLQRMIDERLELHSLVSRVVDKKLSERDAIQQLVLAKLSGEVNRKPEESQKIQKLEERKEELKAENKKLKKKLALNEFLEERKKKLHKKEYPVSMSKSENVSCPDCGQDIFKNFVYSGCVCMGDDMDKKLYLTKSEDGVKVRFGKGWDPENIEMLLEVLRGRRG